jgi:hypothetical protein
LPPERSSARALDTFAPQDAQMSCDQIGDEWAASARERQTAEQNIAANRQNNQVAGYIGAVIFPPAYIATEGNYADKDRIVALQARRDVLIELARTKSCPPLT